MGVAKNPLFYNTFLAFFSAAVLTERVQGGCEHGEGEKVKKNPNNFEKYFFSFFDGRFLARHHELSAYFLNLPFVPIFFKCNVVKSPISFFWSCRMK